MIIGIDVPDYTRLTFETTFLQRLLVCYFLIVKMIKNYLYILKITYSDNAYPITPGEPLKPRLYENY